MRKRSGTRRTSRADAWATISGKARPTCQKQYSASVSPEIMDAIVVYAAECLTMGRGAHRERSVCRRRCRMSGRSGTRVATRAVRLVVEGANSAAGFGRESELQLLPALLLMLWEGGWEWAGPSDSFELANLTPPHPSPVSLSGGAPKAPLCPVA